MLLKLRKPEAGEGALILTKEPDYPYLSFTPLLPLPYLYTSPPPFQISAYC